MPVPLRPDFDAARVRHAARKSKDANQVRRVLAVAAVYDGATRTQAAAIGGVTLQIVRDWVLRFNADGPRGLIDRELIDNVRRTPFQGMGKPEPLKGALAGFWSRRITREHRLVYDVSGKGEAQTVTIIQCRYHY